MSYSTPATQEELMSRINSFKKQLPYAVDINATILNESWKAFQKTQNWDSLKKYLSFNYVAAAFGVLVLDSSAKKFEKYIYRINSVDETGKTIESLLSNNVSCPEIMTYAKPLYYKQTTDGISSTLIWKTTDKRVPHHFMVYRSGSETGEFREYEISKSIYQKKDTLFYSFTDKHMNKGSMYRYIIAPSNSYGNYTMGSDTAYSTNLLAKDATLPTRLSAVAMDSLDAIQLSWQIENPHELDAIELYRGIEYEKDFEKLISLSPASTTFLDKTISSGQRYFYTLKVIDRLGRPSISTNKVFAICNGNRLPLSPLKVITHPEKNGVKISWIPNGENIRGFYVYRCEGIDGEYQQISDFIPYTAKDSLPSYTDRDTELITGATYGYTVKQENNGHLTGTAAKTSYTQVLHGKNKTHLPIVNLNYETSDRHILLVWDLKTSVMGIYGVNVLRKNDTEKEFTPINRVQLTAATQNFSDSTIQSGVDYQYQLSFIDRAGKEVAVSNKIIVKTLNTIPAPPFNVQGIVEGNSIKLSWESASAEVSGFKIYRRSPGQQPLMIGSVKNSVFEFSDKTPAKEETVLYYVIATNKNLESKASNEWCLVKP